MVDYAGPSGPNALIARDAQSRRINMGMCESFCTTCLAFLNAFSIFYNATYHNRSTPHKHIFCIQPLH